MDLADAVRIMDLAVASAFPQVRLLGGEPTLHADFAAILQAALGRGLEVLVFSNGLMPAEAAEALLRAPLEKCHVMLNLNVDSMPETGSHISQVATRLAERAFAGVNIHSPGLPLKRASDFAKAHGLERQIRIGLAHPRLDRQNRYLHPRHYHQVGRELESFFEDIREDGFTLNLDCGFVPCMFTPRFLDATGIVIEEMGCRCGPIPDILPDLTAIHCFPLSELDELPLSGFRTFQEIRSAHEQRVRVLKEVGVFRECSQCSIRQSGKCVGGCPSVALARSHRLSVAMPGESRAKPATNISSPVAPTAAKPWAIPYFDQPLEFWKTLQAEFAEKIREVYFPLDWSRAGAGGDLSQPWAHLRELLDIGTVPLAAVVESPMGPQFVPQIGARIVDQLVSLYEHYGIVAVTLSDLRLAEMARPRLPALRFTASSLMDIAEPEQVPALQGLFDVLLPAPRLLRCPDRLSAVRAAFPGRIRLVVNEGSPGPCRDSREDATEAVPQRAEVPSLCSDPLEQEPWRSLTEAWILPQHLDLVDSLGDEFALAGRMAFAAPEEYRRILHAYVSRTALWPHEIGGGLAWPLPRVPVARAIFTRMLHCDQDCGWCSICRRTWQIMPVAEGKE